MKRWLAFYIASGTTLLAAGCAGHAATPLPGAAGGAPQQRVTAHFRIVVPSVKGHPRRRARGFEHQHFISASAQGVTLTVFPHGQRTGALASIAVNISSGSPSCTGSGNSRNCNAGVSLVPGGPYDFVATIYDGVPSGNTPTGKQLGIGVTTQSVTIGKANDISVAVSGIVNSLSFSLPNATLASAITPVTRTATVSALDADGNTIATDSYIDATGNPLTISLAHDSNGGTAVTLTPASFSSPVPAGIAVAYIPINVPQTQLTNGFNTRLQASATGLTPAAATLIVPAVQIQQYSAQTSDGPRGIVSGPGNQLWVANASGTTLGTVGTGGSQGTYTNVGSLSGSPHVVTVGSDGAVWFTEPSTNKIGRQDPNNLGTTNEYGTGITASAFPEGITSGPDGALWFAEFCAGKIGRSDTLGNITEKPLPSSTSEPDQIVSGPDGNLWFTEYNAASIGRMTTTGTVSEFTVTAASDPAGITVGPDGALWFTEFLGNRIGRMTTSGTLTAEYSIPTSNTDAFGIAVGPDGGIWFTEVFKNQIGRVTTNGTFAEFAVPNGYAPQLITLGPDGALWFTSLGGNVVDRVY